MKSVALLLACNVEGNAADNDVKRPLSNVTDDTLNIAHEMLQMFSVHSFDEHLVDPSLLNVVRNTKMYSENKLNTCIDLLPTKCKFIFYFMSSINNHFNENIVLRYSMTFIV